MDVRSYTEALEALAGRDSRKVANNTKLRRDPHGHSHGCRIDVVLHSTAVVTYFQHGTLQLDSGGWLTMTTADRMNRFTPDDLGVWSNRGRWMVGTGETWQDKHDTSIPFVDGMMLYRDFFDDDRFKSAITLDEDKQRQEDAHNARVRSLLPKFIRALPANPYDVPTSTCAMCYPGADHPTGDWRILGDVMEDRQHLLDHLIMCEPTKELIRAALRDKGLRDTYWDGHYTLTKRALRDFMLQRLIIGAVATKHGKRPFGEPSYLMTKTRRQARKVA